MSGLCKDMPILPSAACGSARGSRQQADWHCAASENGSDGACHRRGIREAGPRRNEDSRRSALSVSRVGQHSCAQPLSRQHKRELADLANANRTIQGAIFPYPNTRLAAPMIKAFPIMISATNSDICPSWANTNRGSNSMPRVTMNSNPRMSRKGTTSLNARWLDSDSIATIPASEPRAQMVPR
jgi:hypothetical protein